MDNLYYEFECGCRIKQHGTHIKENDGFPSLSLDFYNLPNCPKTWELIGTGKTKGVFQLESNLGQNWANKTEPHNLEELAALTALIRPATLDSIVDGKSLTEHYADRKNGRSEVESLHPVLTNILEETQQIILYQEDSIRIAREVAGFSLVKSDILRKAIGKKDNDEMQSLKEEFVNGCMTKSGLTKKDAEDIFSIIENSASYSFNKSHSVAYGSISYATAFVKQHFPIHFYTSWLHWSKEKIDPQQEMRDLISDAKYFDHNIYPPSLSNIFMGDPGDFCLNKNGVYFGLSSIKNIGMSHINKLIEDVKEKEKEIGKKIGKWSWIEFLTNMGSRINKTVMNNLILVGATPGAISRKRSLFEYKLWSQLTDRELKWMVDNKHSYSSIEGGFSKLLEIDRKGGGPATEKRRGVIRGMVENLVSPKYSLDDEEEWISLNEQQLLSVSLSNHILDSFQFSGDWNVKDFLSGGSDKGSLLCVIRDKKEHIIKNGNSAGKLMCFLTLEDQTGKIDSVCFNNVYEKYKDLIFDGSTVLIKGKRSDKNKDSLMINSIEGV